MSATHEVLHQKRFTAERRVEMLFFAVKERLGDSSVQLGQLVLGYRQDADGVTAIIERAVVRPPMRGVPKKSTPIAFMSAT